jgi:glycosyltransferase involved in cell wall biosynthesis
MLRQLCIDIAGYEDELEVIISDNASTDNTARVIEDWLQRVPQTLVVRKFRNDTNLGVSRNIVSLFYRGEGRFLMFLGDDDRVNPNFLPILLALLKGSSPPSVVIQGVWSWRPVAKTYGLVDLEGAARFFYEYGNAYAGVVDRAAAVTAIEKRGWRATIEETLWPQTIIGYLVLGDLNTRRAYVTKQEIGARLTGNFNVYSAEYFKRTLGSLIVAAKLVDEGTGTRTIARNFLTVNCRALKSNIRALWVYCIIEECRLDTSDLRRVLQEGFGLRGYLWATFFRVFESYPVIYTLSRFAHAILHCRSRETFEQRILRFRREYAEAIANRDGKSRVGDWF